MLRALIHTNRGGIFNVQYETVAKLFDNQNNLLEISFQFRQKDGSLKISHSFYVPNIVAIEYLDK